VHNQIIPWLQRSIRFFKAPVNIIIILSFIVSAATPVSSVVAQSYSPSFKKAITSNHVDEINNYQIFNSTENAISPKANFSISSLINNASNPSYYYATGVLETGFVGSPVPDCLDVMEQ